MSVPAPVGHVGRTYRDSEPWWDEPVAPPDGAPNILLVVLDDVGYGSLGCYGAEIETPAMDGLAAGGQRYTNFHVSPLCSPTRASLLTGRNHHSVGMSLLSNADSGFPGKRGAVSHRAATLAEMLREVGYNTAAFGKWHLTPIDQTTSIGPFDQWPLGRGFEHYYGFLEGTTDHFHPELVLDNHRIDPPGSPDDGYHLSTDLADRVIAYVANQQSIAPANKPFFAYLAFGAAHAPHQAPQEYLDRYRGRYDVGWDEIRRERLERQVRLGVVPDGTALPPHNPGVVDWTTLSEDEQRVMARMQEAFAAMLTHCDHELGRVLQALDDLGARDNTLVILLSDNGASQEGGATGCVNTVTYLNGERVTSEENLAAIDDIGGPRVSNNYPWGWAEAGNSPLRRYKQNTHGGGVRAPLVMSWPGHVPQGGAAGQFHYVTDILPTVLEAVGIPAPEEMQGVPQMPVHGTSMAYSWNNPDAATRRSTQYFEMYGHRGIWHEGFKAVTFHPRGSDFDDDVWELYDLDADFAETADLARTHPERLHELIGRWWSEAERYDVFPLDDRNFAERAAKHGSPASPRSRTAFRFHPAMDYLPGGVTPLICDRSYEIAVPVRCDEIPDGVLLAHGDNNGGYVLYFVDGRLHYEYNHQGRRYRVAATEPTAPGEHVVSLVFRRTGSLCGVVSLLLDGREVAAGELASTSRYLLAWQGISLGRDALSPVSWDYRAPFPFNGRLGVTSYTVRPDAPEAALEVFD